MVLERVARAFVFSHDSQFFATFSNTIFLFKIEIMPKEESSAGLCDSCLLCAKQDAGDGIYQPLEAFVICTHHQTEITPVLKSDTQNQVLECEYFISDTEKPTQ